jgi:hypothetical protein
VSDFPSSVTASGESSTYLSEIVALTRENDKLKAQLAKHPRVPTAVTSIVVSEISDPSSLTDSTPDIDLDGYSVMSPPRKLCRTKAPVHTPPSSSNRSQPPKRYRNSKLTYNRFAPLAASTEEVADDMVNNTALWITFPGRFPASRGLGSKASSEGSGEAATRRGGQSICYK